MDSELRKAINVRNMLKRRYDQCSIAEMWKKYKKQKKKKQKQREYVVNFRKKCKIRYLEKISKGKDARVFWQNVKAIDV